MQKINKTWNLLFKLFDFWPFIAENLLDIKNHGLLLTENDGRLKKIRLL